MKNTMKKIRRRARELEVQNLLLLLLLCSSIEIRISLFLCS
jgi:hypothetical protein